MPQPEKQEVPEIVTQTVHLVARLLQEEGIFVVDVKNRSLLVKVNETKVMIGMQTVKS